MVGPVLGYIPQYNLIKSSGSIGTFSPNVCLILLTCNILRICFWFGNRFETALLLQSFIMIIAQLALLHVCVSIRPKKYQTKKELDKYDLDNFWKWNDFRTYLEFLILFAALFASITVTFRNEPVIMEFIGFISVTIEACLGLPQFLQNRKTRSTVGLSNALIISWFLGDSSKTLYYIIKSQPLQFILCGVFQLTLDTLILLQIQKYSSHHKGHDYTRIASD